MRRHKSFVVVIGLVAVLAGPPAAIAAGNTHQDGVLRILLMGSSLVRGVKKNLQTMFEAEGVEVYVGVLAPSLGTLAQHATSKRSMSFLDGKKAAAWDYVILQENGGVQQYPPGMTETTSYQAIENLSEKITRIGATPMLFMVWQDRGINPNGVYGNELWQLLKGTPTGDVGNVPIAFQLDIGVVPVGWSVRAARMADSPYMDEVLYKGGIGHHLSPLGRYLGACAVYAAVTGKTPVGKWAPRKVSPDDAGFLQTIASNVVISNQSEWNLSLSNVPQY